MKLHSALNHFLLALALGFGFTSCQEEESDTNNNSVNAPAVYEFTRNGESTVSYSGQTARLKMGTELSAAFMDFSETEQHLLEMYANQATGGGNVDPFDDAELNASDKSLRSKTAASFDYFANNTAESALIRTDFESWIDGQVNEVFPNENSVAAAGTAGQIADGSGVRYINAKGLEYNQAFAKSLIGALIADQMLNNYLSSGVLDAGANRADNENSVTVEGKAYTNMEHKWDEAYGYLFGNAANGADPLLTLGDDDPFLNKYLARVENDADFSGIANDIFQAFKLGRAAIVARDYSLRDEQVKIIREKVSTVIAVRAVYYLQQGKVAMNNNEMGTAFHALSEGYGFIYSLRFTQNPATGQPYLSASEVDGLLSDLMGDGANGLWDLQAGTIDQLCTAIASRFSFSVAEAAN